MGWESMCKLLSEAMTTGSLLWARSLANSFPVSCYLHFLKPHDLILSLATLYIYKATGAQSCKVAHPIFHTSRNQAPSIQSPVFNCFPPPQPYKSVFVFFHIQRGAESHLGLEVGAAKNRIVLHNVYRVVLLCWSRMMWLGEKKCQDIGGSDWKLLENF